MLRRRSPHWLRSPDLRAIVLSVEEAARPHGGAGALYVRLIAAASRLTKGLTAPGSAGKTLAVQYSECFS